MLSPRAAFASLPPLSLPPPPIPHPPPVAVPRSPAPRPAPSPSRPIPRSPYVNSNISPQRLARRTDSADATPAVLHDVLSERDWVGPGLFLQGQLIRPVPNGPPQPLQAFEVVRRVGSGSYAIVYLVREILSPLPPSHLAHYDPHLPFADDIDLDFDPPPALSYGKEFAIKCLSKANLNRDALDAQLFEATIHQSVPAHPNVVTLHRTLETDSYLLLVLEYVPGEDLFYFLEQARDHSDGVPDQQSLPPSVTPPTPSLLSSLHPAQLLSPHRLRLIASMFSQMCEAVAHCHSAGIFHRDIKPENFIVTDGWVNGERKVVVKLSDFGLATIDSESTDMDCGSAPYMSYECRNNLAPTYSTGPADVWSLGIVLINMLYHHNPWSDTTALACPSFEAFRDQPVPFFMQRFPGLTRPVAKFLATRVFCLLEDPAAERVSAAEFGRWIRGLPSLLAHQETAGPVLTGPGPFSHLPPVTPSPRSRRPSSRPPSRGPTPMDSRPPSQREFELAEPDLPEADEEVEASSRSTSATARRRKRGARKGRGSSGTSVASPPSDPLEDLAAASQDLAREISKASRSPARPTLTPPATPKKSSKWKGVFRMASSDDLPAPPPPLPPAAPPQQRIKPSSTAENVSTLIMGLSPAPPRGEREKERDWRARGRGADSSNWRRTSSSTASSMSGFTRFSNGSVRSVSTVATTVSAESWRAIQKDRDRSPPPSSAPAPAHQEAQQSYVRKQEHPVLAPPGIKIMSGVPWELVSLPGVVDTPPAEPPQDELPRGCHVRPQDHVFAPPPLRYRMKAQEQARELDTINEPASDEDSATTSPEQGPRKVQKGQIHALAKMLSALKTNRGAH